MRYVVYLEGDIEAIAIDPNTGRLEIYDNLYEEDDLENSPSDEVLIQVDLWPSERILLAKALLQGVT